MGAAGSVVYPSDGVGNYTGLRAFLKQSMSSNPVARENALIVVMNGTTTSGLAEREANDLIAKGFDVSDYTNADHSNYQNSVIYQLRDGYSATAAKLAQIYGVKVTKAAPPFSVNETTDFVVITGVDRANSNL